LLEQGEPPGRSVDATSEFYSEEEAPNDRAALSIPVVEDIPSIDGAGELPPSSRELRGTTGATGATGDEKQTGVVPAFWEDR